MAQAAVRAKVDQALDRDADLASQVALDDELADLGAQALDLGLERRDARFERAAGRRGAVAAVGLGRHGGAVVVAAAEQVPVALLLLPGAPLETLDELAAAARRGTVTLIYGARDREHNQAQVIADELEQRGVA